MMSRRTYIVCDNCGKEEEYDLRGEEWCVFTWLMSGDNERKFGKSDALIWHFCSREHALAFFNPESKEGEEEDGGEG